MSKNKYEDNQPVIPARGRPKNERTELTVLFCLNAYQGASEADNSNLDYWLFQAGFTRHDKDSMGPDKWNKLKKKQL